MLMIQTCLLSLLMICEYFLSHLRFQQTMVPQQSTSEATANPLLATERNGLEPPSPVPSGANGVNTEVKSLTSHTCGKRSDDD